MLRATGLTRPRPGDDIPPDNRDERGIIVPPEPALVSSGAFPPIQPNPDFPDPFLRQRIKAHQHNPRQHENSRHNGKHQPQPEQCFLRLSRRMCINPGQTYHRTGKTQNRRNAEFENPGKYRAETPFSPTTTAQFIEITNIPQHRIRQQPDRRNTEIE